MGSASVTIGPALAVALVALVVVAATVAWLGRTGHARAIPWVALRAALQLVVLSLVIGLVARTGWAIVAFVSVMCCTAVVTATRRARGGGAPWRSYLWVALPVAVPPVVLVAALLGVGVLRPDGLSVIPVAGILLGNAMSVAGLAGRRAADELDSRHGEVEAALSLGFGRVDARMLVCREAAATAFGPSLDQTRTIGLVTIPGAFVGMVLGGAQPWEAGVMQLFVSVGILAVGSVALVGITLAVAAEKV